MSKNKLFNIKDKIDGNEVDLSLCNLTDAPVKELASVPKVTIVDLSCNNITMLTAEFCGLVHLVKLDLNKNQLEALPEAFGSLGNLQHLDLLGNRLSALPLSFCRLRSLKWLDLKDNPLEPDLAKVAGDCLDERQCKQCAAKVLEHMKQLQEEVDKIRQKKLQREKDLEKKREAKQREREAKERQARKREKLEEKERRRQEYNQQVAAQQTQEQHRKKQEERKKNNNGKSTDQKPAAEPAAGPKCSLLGVVLKLLILVTLGLLAAVAACHLPGLRELPACRGAGLLAEEGASWAGLRELLLNLSAGARQLADATRRQLTDEN